MSSCRLWRETARPRKPGQHDREGDKKPRMSPPLLRLDSTGEITSERGASATKGQPRTSACRVNETLSNLMNSLNMGTVIDTTSQYLGSASSYLKLCTPDTVNSLVSEQSNPIKNLMSGLFNTCNMPMNAERLPTSMNTCTMASSPGDTALHKGPQCAPTQGTSNSRFDCLKSQGSPNLWTKGFIGAIHGCMPQYKTRPHCPYTGSWRDNTCSLTHSSPHGRSRRVPKPQSNSPSDEIDPTLKPYNARLLEKSRIMQQERAQNTSKEKANCDTPRRPNCLKRDAGFIDSQLVEGKQNQTVSHEMMEGKLETVETEIIPEKTDCVLQPVETESVEDSCTDKQMDWFEYESDLPTVEVLAAATTDVSSGAVDNKESDSTTVTVEDGDLSTSPSLHSWLSMEETEIEATCQASPDGNSVNIHVKSSDNEKPSKDNKSKAGNVQKWKIQVNETDDMNLRIEFSQIPLNCEKDTKKCEVSSEHKDLSFSLYERSSSGGKKSRPSARKRRRQKAKQEESPANGKQKSKKDLSEGKAHYPMANSVSVILGTYHEETGSKGSPTHSFIMSFDEDSEYSDWSDSESDESGLDFAQDDCSEMFAQFGGMNLQVFCSVAPTPTSTQETTNDVLDGINRAWKNMNDCPAKTPSNKKVHFAEDKDLATVHKMVAWAHAYEAARKGPWEEYARDRGRFMRRITDSNTMLKPILQAEHRSKVYAERFQDC